MKRPLLCLALLLAVPPALAADPDAGRAKAAEVCSACHGQNGVSVSDTIPNLAGQRAAYLESQLRALKDAVRKNPTMNAIAAQLSEAEIGNVAAYYASLPGATAAAKSAFLPALARSGVRFPDGYQNTYVRYHTIDFPATKQVRYYYANPTAAKAAKDGQALPDGSVLFAEVWSAKLDAAGKPVAGADGRYTPDKLLFYTAMAREAGWGRDIPPMLRNDDWNYAVFTTAKEARASANQAECLACHKPLDKASYTFTLKELADAAKRM
ncbi:MAG: cytochrome P460 family protein [Burkholderiales bacterium]